jgi:hypothetical protein
MVAYSLGQNRNASNIDGLGTELATTDTVTTNAFTLTFDSGWTNKACDDISISNGGKLINDAGVSVTWDAGAVITVAGDLIANGTSGSPITWTTLAQVTTAAKASILLKYVTANLGGGYGIFANGFTKYIVIIHCTLEGTQASNAFMIPYNGECFIIWINCTLTSPNRVIRPAYAGPYWLVNTTISTPGTDWAECDNASTLFYIIGTSNFNGGELLASELNQYQDGVIKYYSKVKVTVNDGTDPLQNAVITVRKKTGDSEVLFEPYWNDLPDAILDSKTDSNGIGYVYVLTKVYNQDGTWTYYSDENQAEAGDNSPYYISASYPDYQSPATETEVWGIESGNDSTDETDVGTISCSEVSAGGRQPRERRHGV